LSGFYLDLNNNCQSCGTNCTECKAKVCTECQVGFYVGTNGKCKACHGTCQNGCYNRLSCIVWELEEKFNWVVNVYVFYELFLFHIVNSCFHIFVLALKFIQLQ